MADEKQTAIDHIRLVREAFAPMMRRFEAIFHEQWIDHDRFWKMLLDAARPLRVLPNPSRLYREPVIPPDKVGRTLNWIGDRLLHKHTMAAARIASRLCAGAEGVPSAEEIERQIRDNEAVIRDFYINEVPPPVGQYRAGLPADLRTLLGQCQYDDPEHIYHLGAWVNTVEHNAWHVLTGEVPSKHIGLPIVAKLTEILRLRAKLADCMVLRRYDSNPPGTGHLVDFISVPLGDYGMPFAVTLATTAALMLDWAAPLEAESRELARKYPAMVDKLARAGDDGARELAPLRAFREGIFTLLFGVGMMTVERNARFPDPVLLVSELVAQGVPTQMAARSPALLIGPMGLAGAYIPGFITDDGTQLALNEALYGQFHSIRVGTRGDHSLPAAGYGCPLAYPLEGEPAQIDTLARLFTVLLIQVDLLKSRIRATLLAEVK